MRTLLIVDYTYWYWEIVEDEAVVEQEFSIRSNTMYVPVRTYVQCFS